MYCTSCGTKNVDEARFCCACGSAIKGTATESESSPASNPQPPKHSIDPLLDSILSFDGRISRAKFWNVSLLMFAGYFVIGLLLFCLKQTKLEGSLLYSAMDILGLSWLILSIFVALSLQTRRWHDLGHSGWMAVLSLIPILGIASFIWAGCVKGIRGTNKFGGDPLAGLDDGTPNAGYELLSEATRLELSGRIAEALSAYERIANQYANTAVGTDAQRSAESLREKRK